MKAYTYNPRREDYLTAKRQIEMIKDYWTKRGCRIKDIGLNKEDKRYITYTVIR